MPKNTSLLGDCIYGRCEKRVKVRVVAEEKYDIIRELLDTNMVFRILHNNLDEMVAESIHKVSLSDN